MKNGFTLIELLAVVVLLSLLVFMATPVVAHLIELNQKRLFEDNLELIEKTLNHEYLNNGINGYNKEIIYTIDNFKFVGNKIEVNGSLPEKGSIILMKDGSIFYALYRDGFCGVNSVDGYTLTETTKSGCKLYMATNVMEVTPVDIPLACGDGGTYDELSSKFPDEAQVKLENNTIINVPVFFTESIDNFDPKYNKTVIKGELTLPEGVYNFYNIEAELTFTVPLC